MKQEYIYKIQIILTGGQKLETTLIKYNDNQTGDQIRDRILDSNGEEYITIRGRPSITFKKDDVIGYSYDVEVAEILSI